MCDSSFALASPERTEVLKEQLKIRTIDWKLCFICGIKEPNSVQISKPFSRKGKMNKFAALLFFTYFVF